MYEFGDLSSTSTRVTSDSVMSKIRFVTGAVKREITPQQAGESGAGTFIFRLHLLLEAKDSMRVWITLLPGSRDSQEERLKPLMGLPTFPGMSYELTHSTKKTIKGAVLMPRANNQKLGIFAMAILDTTLVERPPGSDDPPQVDPTSYVTAVKNLFKKGCLPNKCEGHALQDKLLNYAGNMALYSPANRKRQSFYATSTPPEDIITIGKSRMTCIAGGKYRELQTFGAGAMVNSLLPDSVTEEAYKLVSMSITVNTAKTYRSAESILGPASAWLGRPICVPFTDSDAVALVVYMKVMKSLRSTTICVYFSGFRMLHLMKACNAPNLRTGLVNQMIAGVKNGNQAADVLSDRKSRQPVTIEVMSKLQQSLKSSRKT